MQPGIPEIAPASIELPFCVTDLKQWVYCPRILYFRLCLPAIRPVTYKMQAGIEDGEAEAQRESRRSLRTYGLKSGRREYDVALASERLGLRGKIDMLILREEPGEEELIPVDYKLSDAASPHFRLQLMAYGLLLEDCLGGACKRGFIYSIPRRKSEEVQFTRPLRRRCGDALAAMQHMLYREAMPAPAAQRGKCVNCEFRRFCNDVL